jgi:hypothetical protein
VGALHALQPLATMPVSRSPPLAGGGERPPHHLSDRMPSRMPTLFDPLTLGTLTLPNRILMAPLTRARAGRSHIANALMAEH